ncbi:MAG: hypothetical protein K1X79_02675 [Oligoflexia bacterium]|nr:hypothetical protein [Oligoflexia bacterium]
MGKDGSESQVVELVDEFAYSEGVCFDPERITLEGLYCDQLSAYRARRVWEETLGHSFLLEPKHDFILRVKAVGSEPRYALRCEFLTACARYAFWRLTNNQAPEAQYIIETAHIPQAESRQDELWTAPDLKQKQEAAALQQLAQMGSQVESDVGGISSILMKIVQRLRGAQ